MTPIDLATLHAFLERLGSQCEAQHELVLLGGGALLLLGSPRSTVDIDYVGDDIEMTDFQRVVGRVANELGLKADPVPIGDFLPIPSGSDGRRVHVGRFGAVEVYVIDPYVIALSKLDRGLDSDLGDVVFLVDLGKVTLGQLEERVTAMAPYAATYEMDPAAMRKHLAVVRKRIAAR